MRQKIKRALRNLLVSLFLCTLWHGSAWSADFDEEAFQRDIVEDCRRRAQILKTLDRIEPPTRLSPTTQPTQIMPAQPAAELEAAQEQKYQAVPDKTSETDAALAETGSSELAAPSADPAQGISEQETPHALPATETTSAPEEKAKDAAAENRSEDTGPRRFLPEPVRPYIWAGTGYSDNIFLSKNKTGSMINTLNPGVKLLWNSPNSGFKTNKLQFDGGAKLYSYIYDASYNQALPYANASLQIGKNKHSFLVSNFYQQQYKASSSLDLGLTGFQNYSTNNSLFSWESAFNRFGFDLDYNRIANTYEGAYKSNSSAENIYSPTIFLQAFPKTRFFLGYNYGTQAYAKSASQDKDNRYNRVWLGVKDKITEKTSGVIQAGYEDRRFGDSENDRKSLAVKMDLTYQYTPKLAFLLKAAKGSKEPGYVRETFNEGTDFSVHALYHFSPKLSIDTGGDYAHDKYRSGRIDDFYSFSTKLNFAYHKWLTLVAGYRYGLRNSNDEEADYNSNVFTLENKLEF